MEKEKLLEAKEKILEMIIEKVNGGNYELQDFGIINAEINQIEYKENSEKSIAQSKEYQELLIKALNK